MPKAKSTQPSGPSLSRYRDRPESNLVTINIANLSEANAVFGEKTSKGYTPLVLVPRHRTIGRLVVPHGFDAIVVKNGNTLGVFRPGVYWLSHFYQVSYLITRHKIPYHSRVVNLPTKDNVRVDVYVDYLLHVRDSITLMKKISPENMEELLKATQAEAVRSMVRTVRVDQAYDLCGSDTSDMQAALNDKMNPYGVAIDKVTICAVRLPDDVSARLQNTATFEFKQILETKNQELRLRTLHEKQTIESTEQLRKNEQGRTQELANKNRQMIEQELTELEDRHKHELERMEDRLFSETARIKAETELEIGRIDAERAKLVSEIHNAGIVEANKILGQGQRSADAIRAETTLKLSEVRARLTAVRAEAERAAQALRGRRAYEVERRRLDVVRAIAANPEAVVCGDEAESLFSTLAAATGAADLVGIKLPGKR
eukprot:m51a1_g4791 hypothetical protein (430) ;mRNA; r:72700-74826